MSAKQWNELCHTCLTSTLHTQTLGCRNQNQSSSHNSWAAKITANPTPKRYISLPIILNKQNLWKSWRMHSTKSNYPSVDSTTVIFRYGKMAQKLRALSALPEDPDLIPSSYMATYSCLWLQFWGIWHPLLASVTRFTCVTQTYMKAKHPYTH